MERTLLSAAFDFALIFDLKKRQLLLDLRKSHRRTYNVEERRFSAAISVTVNLSFSRGLAANLEERALPGTSSETGKALAASCPPVRKET